MDIRPAVPGAQMHRRNDRSWRILLKNSLRVPIGKISGVVSRTSYPRYEGIAPSARKPVLTALGGNEAASNYESLLEKNCRLDSEQSRIGVFQQNWRDPAHHFRTVRTAAFGEIRRSALSWRRGRCDPYPSFLNRGKFPRVIDSLLTSLTARRRVSLDRI
jgi:hypothetical protein